MEAVENVEERRERSDRGGRHRGSITLDPDAIKAAERSMAIRGWSRETWAEEAGVAHATVARMLRGEGTSPDTLIKLTEALKRRRVNPDLADLIDGTFDR